MLAEFIHRSSIVYLHRLRLLHEPLEVLVEDLDLIEKQFELVVGHAYPIDIAVI